MNPGLPEEGGKVAVTAIDAMRSQPLMLAVLILNALIFGFVYFGVREQRTQQADLFKQLLDQNHQMSELLSKCIVPSH